jgi:hypothetical protein
MSSVCTMSAACTGVAPGAWETQSSLSGGAALSTMVKVFSVSPNRRREDSELGVARGSRTGLVCMSCFRSSAGGAKRSWPFNHENVH